MSDSTKPPRSQLDPTMITQSSFDESLGATRVTVVGANLPDFTVNQYTQAIQKVEIPTIVAQTQIQPVDKIVLQTDVQTVQVPQIITQTQIEQVDKIVTQVQVVEIPVITKEIQIVEVPIPVKTIEFVNVPVIHTKVEIKEVEKILIQKEIQIEYVDRIVYQPEILKIEVPVYMDRIQYKEISMFIKGAIVATPLIFLIALIKHLV